MLRLALVTLVLAALISCTPPETRTGEDMVFPRRPNNLAPTVLEVAGAPMGDHIQGQSFVYIHWMQYPDEGELYDLVKDPYETRNVINDPQYAGVVRDLRAEMATAVLDAMGLER